MSIESEHWEDVYAQREPADVSWYEDRPRASLELIAAADLGPGASILDLGGGTSALAGALLDAGYTDITVSDISDAALRRSAADWGEKAERIDWIHADVRGHDFGRRFDLWHDRAVFHFMVDAADRKGYLTALERGLRPGGHLILATFGPDGPTTCSGLPTSRYSADRLAEGLGPDFELISSDLRLHRTPSGRDQQFLWTHFRRLAPGPP